MPKIKQLSLHEAQKIAAGEVVERPAHIVKELLENAIDAGATQISLYLEEGGKTLIRVVDNGCGMDIDDAQLCFQKHATSKISSVDELDQINTFGFRGEALASVAAVSQVTLVTKEADALEGIKVTVAQNSITSIEAVSAVTGTDITVADLFYNIPARKKFLKTRETELRGSMQLLQAFSLGYPAIHFKLFSERQLQLNCPPVEHLSTRFMQLWNIDTFLPLAATHAEHKINLTGVVSYHQQYRYDRSALFFIVNGRWVKDTKLTNALLKGYKLLLPPGRYPLACISMTVDPTQVDINIHPRKEEIRFMHPRIAEQLVQEAVTKALEQQVSDNLGHKKNDVVPIIIPAAPARTFVPFDFERHQAPAQPYAHAIPEKTIESFVPQKNLSIEPEKQAPSSTVDQQMTSPLHQQTTHSDEYEHIPTIIGQYHQTYILLAQDDGLFIVDQHAAHERILYELFAMRFEQLESIRLLFPTIIQLSTQDIQLIEPHLHLLVSNGIHIEQFGQTQLIVQAIPVHIKNVNLQELIKLIVGWLAQHQQLAPAELGKELNEQLHAQMACKAAVKAGDQLALEQMQQIIKDLHKTPNRFACPHGRPTGFLVSLHEIEKKFRRKT